MAFPKINLPKPTFLPPLSKKQILILAGLLVILLTLPLAIYLVQQQIQYRGKAAGGNVYYIAPDGNDSNLGTESQPWRTVQKAANTLVAGDTVYIKAGTYNERVSPQNSGTPGNYITYTAYPGHTVTIDGNGISISWGGVFDVSDRSYINVSGLRVINSAGAGIFADGSSYIIIEKNYTYNTVSSGIGIWGSNNVIVDGNNVELACNDGSEECISVSGSDLVEVKNNHVHDGGPGTRGGEGIDIKDGSSNVKVYKNHVHHLPKRQGIYVDGWDSHNYNIEIFANLVHDCYDQGFSVGSERGGLVENVRIYNNVAYNNGGWGFDVATWDVDGPRRNIAIINNTAYGNGTRWGGGIGVRTANVESIVVRNNIVSQNVGAQMGVASGATAQTTIDHNLFYGGSAMGSEPVVGNPLFVNPGGGDFHLQSGSPAIDKGSSVGAPNDDFEGNSRPQGAGYDIGAYEYTSDVQPTNTPTPTPLPPTVTPTPRPTATLTPTPRPNSTPTPTPTPPPGGYLELDLLKVWFWKQEGALGRGHAGSVILALKQGGSVVLEKEIKLDENGEVRDVELPGVEAGTYDAFIYEAGYLTKKLANISIGATGNVLDFTKAGTEYFLVGDFNGDQEVNILDFSIFVKSYNKSGEE